MNWTKLADEYGNIYYLNNETGEGTWDQPEDFQSSPRNLDSWEEVVNDGNEKYYYHAKTGTSAWTHPHQKSSWDKSYDDSGQAYYFNIVTGISQYDLPAELMNQSDPADEETDTANNSIDEAVADSGKQDEQTSGNNSKGVWNVEFDSDGNFFFKNSETGEIKWELDEEAHDIPEKVPGVFEELSRNNILPEVLQCVELLVYMVIDASQSKKIQKGLGLSKKRDKEDNERIWSIETINAHIEYQSKKMKRQAIRLERHHKKLDILKRVKKNRDLSQNAKDIFADAAKAVVEGNKEREIEKLKDRFRNRRKLLKAKEERISLTKQRHLENKVRYSLTVKLAKNVKFSGGKIPVFEKHHEDSSRDRLFQKIFILADDEKTGCVSLRDVLQSVESNKKIGYYISKHDAVQALFENSDVQNEFLKLNTMKEGFITIKEFISFMTILSQVYDHIECLKLAQQDADKAKVRKSKRCNKNSMATKKFCLTQRKASYGVLQYDNDKSNLRENWQKNHSHRIICHGNSKPYCCVCRERKWEFQKIVEGENEQKYIELWEETIADKLAKIKKKIIIEFQKKKIKMISAGVCDDKLLKKNEINCALKAIEDDLHSEEDNRSKMYIEDGIESWRNEKCKRDLERPLREFQEHGQQEYLSIVEAMETSTSSWKNSQILIGMSMFQRIEVEYVLSIKNRYQLTFVGRDGVNGTQYYIRTIPYSNEDEASYAQQQARIIKNIDNPFLVPIKYIHLHNHHQFSPAGDVVENVKILLLAMEYCEHGTFEDQYFTRKFTPSIGNRLSPGNIKESQLLNILRDITACLSALHSQNIGHYNIKCRNICLTSSLSAKLGGFLVFENPFDKDWTHYAICRNIAPPELMRGGIPTLKADIWSLGCLIYHITTGTERSLFNYEFSSVMRDIPLRYGTNIRSLLRMLLQHDPDLRPTSNDIFDMLCLWIGNDENVSPTTTLLEPKKHNQLPPIE